MLEPEELWLRVEEPVPLPDPVGEALTEPVGVPLPVALAVGVTERDCVLEPLSEPLTVGEEEALPP